MGIFGCVLAVTSLLINKFTSLTDHSKTLNFLFIAGLLLAASNLGKKPDPEESEDEEEPIRLSRIQECPYCHTELELDESEQRRRQFECLTCNEVIDFSDKLDPYRDEELPEKVYCPKCHHLVQLDNIERTAKRYDCPYCSSHIEYTAKPSNNAE